MRLTLTSTSWWSKTTCSIRYVTPRQPLWLATDTSRLQKILLRILQQLGYAADVAADGRQAIEMVAQKNYDLILMDIAMPVMNGLDASRYISRNWDEEHRPVIVGVTANAVTKEINEYVWRPCAGNADNADYRNVVHRDLKSQNIMFTLEGEVKVRPFVFVGRLCLCRCLCVCRLSAFTDRFGRSSTLAPPFR